METDWKVSPPPPPDDNKRLHGLPGEGTQDPKTDPAREGTEPELTPKPRKYPKPLR